MVNSSRKGILITSSVFDKSTDDVIAWLLYWDVPYKRINEPDKIALNRLVLTKEKHKACIVELNVTNINGETEIIDINNFMGFWYRRGKLSLYQNVQTKNNIQSNIIDGINRENQKIEEFIEFFVTKNHKHLNKFSDNNQNKLSNLFIARECGFEIPNSYVLTQKSDLFDIFNKFSSIITKSIGEFANTFYDDGYKIAYGTPTQIVTKEEMIPPTFQSSLFQNNINKKVEIRVFYLCGRLFSMAIFSQLDEQTKVDFRNYNREKENRNVPFQLPKEEEKKVKMFMQKIDLNSGSIDLIYDGENFVFLEVNPVGQFQWVSKNCNYYIEKIIAKQLAYE